jgi:hypothetical protein
VSASTYNQEHVLESCRISFPLHVRLDGRVAIFGKHAYTARVETRDVERHAPHARVKDAAGIATQVPQALSGPIDRAVVGRDAERCGLRNQVACTLVQLEEPVEIGVRQRVEGDLRKTSSQAVGIMATLGSRREYYASSFGHWRLTKALTINEQSRQSRQYAN